MKGKERGGRVAVRRGSSRSELGGAEVRSAVS